MPLFSSPIYADDIGKSTMVRFGGYTHTRAASEGEIYDMENMSSDEYPLLSPRKPRYLADSYGGRGDFISHDGKRFFFENDGRRRSTAVMGNYLIVMPDKIYYDLSEDEPGAKNIEVSITGNVTIGDGTYAGEAAAANTLTLSSPEDASLFRVGDAVTLSGFTGDYADNNKTPIIEEIEGAKLIFLENTFILGEGETSYSADNITASRTMPDMDFICAHDNRIWGCKGDTVYCSRLGDPLVWNAFDGASGCFAASVGSAGDFTGCVSYLGYVIFFKEDHIYKVYGSKPSNFQMISSASLGVKKGSGHSFGIAGEVLFYHSRAGIVAYSGGIPQNISASFGDEIYSDAVGGSDGVKYYVSMKDGSGEYHLFVYDTRTNLWMREDNTNATSICYDRRLYIANADGSLYALSGDGDMESKIFSMVEFGDFYMGSPNKKGVGKLQIRTEVEEGASLTFYIQFDGGEWKKVGELTAEKKRSYYLPIVPRRCDHFRIKIEGRGLWRLYSLTKESYIGSEL